MEILTVQTSAAIGKMLWSLWTKKTISGAKANASLRDLIGLEVEDTESARRVERLVENVTDSVALTSSEVLRSSHLSRDRQEMVVNILRTTLELLKIDERWIATKRLDKDSIQDAVSKLALSSMKGLHDDDVLLFDLLATETISAVVDCASRMPQIQSFLLTDLITESRKVSAGIEKMLVSQSEIRLKIGGGQDRSQQFEAKYREALARQLEHVQLFGVKADDQYRQFSLPLSYISLEVEGDTSEGDSAEEEISDAQVEDVIAQDKRVVITGTAGSGKTTVLKWLAVTTAQRDHKESLSPWNEYVPFYIPLRSFVDKPLPTPEEFVDEFTRSTKSWMGKGWVQDQLESGRACVLIDSVDELPEHQRNDVAEWIEDLCSLFPNASYVVTARPYALSAQWLTGLNFKRVSLQPLDRESVFELIERWHDAAGFGVAAEGERSSAELLKHYLVSNQSTMRLASSPLLCAVICALFHQHNAHLPSSRSDLYGACVEMLLDGRAEEQELRVENIDYPSISLQKKISLLSHIALLMIRNSQTTASRVNVQEIFESKISDLALDTTGDDIDGELIIKLFVERCAILREVTVETLDFPHRTFQEYLAALALAEGFESSFLADQIENDTWHEVIILFAGIARKPESEQLIKALISQANNESANKLRLSLLAVSAADAATDLSAELRASVMKQLQSLLPPQTLTEAKAVAQAGEMAIPYLVRSAVRNANEAKSAVRALTLIGGDNALAALATYKSDKRRAVVTELVKGLTAFETDSYVRDVLVNHKPTRLEMKSPESVTGIERLDTIRSLVLKRPGTGVRMESLGRLNELESLRIEHPGYLLNLNGLENSITLKNLSVLYSHTGVNLHAVAGINNLESLSLYSVSSELPMPDFRKHTALTDVNIGYLYAADEQFSLGHFIGPNVRRLDAIGVEQVDTLEVPISDSLLHLSLRYESIDALEFLGKFTNLESLNLACFLPMYEFVEELQASLVGNPTPMDIPWDKLTKLRRISMHGISNSNYEQISGCSNIRVLEIYGLEISYPAEGLIELIGNLPNLTYARFSFSRSRGEIATSLPIELRNDLSEIVKSRDYCTVIYGADVITHDDLDERVLKDDEISSAQMELLSRLQSDQSES